MSLLYYFPNRPVLIPPDPVDPLHPEPNYINSLQASGKFVGEQKFNGDNVQIYTDDFSIWNRKKERHNYRLPEATKKELKQFPKGCLLNAELMNNHTKTVKDLLILHCVMAWKGKPLLGKTWGDSRDILEGLAWLPQSELGQTNYGCHLLLSRTWTTGFWDLFKKADGKIIEGIVLKNPAGKLVHSTTPIDDVPWMKKIRLPKPEQYSF